MEYRIRNVTIEDLEAVTEVEAVCFPEAEAADRAAFKQRIEAFPESFFVMEADGRIIGFINGCVTDQETICDEMFEDTCWHQPDGAWQSVFGLDVLPEYQHQGLASKLMEHLIEDARAKKRSGLILTCKDRLIGFYEKFGYHIMGVSGSVHGGAVWYDAILRFGQQEKRGHDETGARLETTR